MKRSLCAALLCVGLSAAGCSSKPAPGPTGQPTKSSPVASATASPTASATPSATASASASPTASASPSASATPNKERKAPEVGMRRLEFPAAGVEFSVPENFSDFEDVDGWQGSMSPDKKLFVLVRAQEWKEWDDVLKACGDLLKDFKASDDKVTKDKTVDGIEVWYDYGVATIQGKPHAVLVAGYQLQEHDFDMVIAADPDDKKGMENAVKILTSVTRQAKYQEAEDKKNEE